MIDWTAWAEIGMASRGSIPKMMEMAGIDMLPPRVGIPVVRRELTASGPGGEVVVAGSLGLMAQERHPTGGIDPEQAPADDAAPRGPMTGRIAAMRVGEGVSVLADLDPARQAFLDDHRIDGTPVLPGVMGIEAFAEAVGDAPAGWHVAAVEDVDLHAPVKFYRDEPRTLEVRALLRDAGDGVVVADCSLIGRRRLRGGEEQETVHFTGRVRLTTDPPPAPEAAAGRPSETPPGSVVEHDAVYRVYFHGPAYQVLDRAWRGNGAVLGRAGGRPAARPRAARPADGDGAAPDRALLPDRRRLRARHRRADGAADARRSGDQLPGRRLGPALGGGQAARRTATASTPRSSTTRAGSGCGSRATARSSSRGPTGEDVLEPLRAAMT